MTINTSDRVRHSVTNARGTVSHLADQFSQFDGDLAPQGWAYVTFVDGLAAWVPQHLLRLDLDACPSCGEDALTTVFDSSGVLAGVTCTACGYVVNSDGDAAVYEHLTTCTCGDCRNIGCDPECRVC